MTGGQYPSAHSPSPTVSGHGSLTPGGHGNHGVHGSHGSHSGHGGAGAAVAADPLSAAAGPGALSSPRKLAGRRRRETVAVLLFSGAPIFESSIPLSVFGVDRQDAGVPRYRLLVCAGEEGPLTTTGGLTLTAPYGLEALSRAGTIVVPAWRSISQPPPVEAIAALRKAHHEGARIIGLCTGAFVLAAAGLLDGRPATTHWMYAPTLAKRYPRVHVDPRELFVDDGDVLTSAGTAAGIDLCLHVVRSDHGAEAANALARRLVVPNRRGGGGQAQYIDQSLPEEIGNDPLAEVVTWALENLNQQFDVEVLAARAYMSRRTFDRRFRTLTGSAPLQWLITQRVLQAQRLLETSDLSVDDVARRCGFRSPVALRGHFRRQLGVSPAAYRTTFRARRPAVGGPVAPQSQGGAAERGPLQGGHPQPPHGPVTHGQHNQHGQHGQPAPGGVGTGGAGGGANGPGAGAAGRQRPRPLVPPQAGPPPGAFGGRAPERPVDPRYAGRAAGQAAPGGQPHQPGSHGQPGQPGQPGPYGQPSAQQGPPPAHAHAQPSPGQPVRPSAAYPGGRGSAERPDRPVEHAIAEDADGEQPGARGRQAAHRPESEPERGARGAADFGPDGARAVSGARDRAVG
ncbi:putative AraC family transcriptional regulator [Kitasatospora setae KM-6054]|uniref:Putative AraC family transcriptional regulator n=1 Tax=Kitasatospora setae (strain ATCC 33774 / DSM 43861 / JCM 3304 / KCC A-0304 / NBRC 14216 / KM-6054) TaxID=452652 RepID=E4NBC4_KITSK|nr:putative AraC family transcriptional regulator [Kitasatospora setae KM-6054]